MQRFNSRRREADYEYGPEGAWGAGARSPFAPSPPHRRLSGSLEYDVGAVTAQTRSKPKERPFYPDHGERLMYYTVDHQKEILKQRTVRPTHSVPDQHRQFRARSLSFSRPVSEESIISYESIEDHRPSRRVPVKYHKQQPLSLTSSQSALEPWPRAQSPDRDVRMDQERVRRRDGYSRGYVIEQPNHSLKSRVPMPAPFFDDMKLPGALQRMSLGPDMRVLSTRSASFDAKRNPSLPRRALSPSPRQTEQFEPPIQLRPKYPKYREVHVLILTWTFHDLRTAPYTAPPSPDYVSLEEETRRLHQTFGSYGYKVQDWAIPMERPEEKLRNRLKKFCRLAADDRLLIVYYHGHGSLDDDNELVFSSHEHPSNLDWCQAAAAELYAAMLTGEACAHSRTDTYNALLKKYERYRPIAEVKWDSLREIVLGAPCDLLLILDCCAAGGANLRHVNWQPANKLAEGYTKHLFAACGFESSTSDDMTAAMCDVLHDLMPPGGAGAGGGGGTGAEFLTTKRLHQIMEDQLQKESVGSQPIFKQLLPQDPEQYIALPNLLMEGERRGRRSGRGWYVDVEKGRLGGWDMEREWGI